jgi:hypothetical protein
MRKPNPVESSTLHDAGSDAALDPKVLETLGRALKAHYDDLVQAPLPEKFLDLLSRLEAQEAQTKPECDRNASG